MNNDKIKAYQNGQWSKKSVGNCTYRQFTSYENKKKTYIVLFRISHTCFVLAALKLSVILSLILVEHFCLSANGCTFTDRTDISCTSNDGAEICEEKCSDDQQLTGSNTAYQTCSKYSMWGEDLRSKSYNYPQCAGTCNIYKYD